MVNNYKTFWFSSEELKVLWASLQEVRDIKTAENRLESIYDEISIAYVRAQWFTPDLGRIAVSLGHEETAIPLKFSEEDIKVLSALPLASTVKEVLS